LWHFSSKGHSTKTLEILLQPEEIQEIDIFDKIQLAGVIDVCKSENSISSAGRKLFSTTRTKKKTSNDADRLSKYLARFGLNWKQIKEVLESKGKSN
jgi:transcriptional regulatory protein RtcR